MSGPHNVYSHESRLSPEMSELINKAMRRKPVVWEDGQIFPVEEASIKKLTWVVACPGNGSS